MPNMTESQYLCLLQGKFQKIQSLNFFHSEDYLRITANEPTPANQFIRTVGLFCDTQRQTFLLENTTIFKDIYRRRLSECKLLLSIVEAKILRNNLTKDALLLIELGFILNAPKPKIWDRSCKLSQLFEQGLREIRDAYWLTQSTQLMEQCFDESHEQFQLEKAAENFTLALENHDDIQLTRLFEHARLSPEPQLLKRVSQELVQTQAHLQAEIERRDQEIIQKETAHQTQMAALMLAYNKQAETHQLAYQQQITALQETHQQMLSRTQTEHQKIIQAERVNTQQAMEAERAKHAHLITQYEEALATMKASHKAELANITETFYTKLDGLIERNNKLQAEQATTIQNFLAQLDKRATSPPTDIQDSLSEKREATPPLHTDIISNQVNSSCRPT